MYIYNYVFVIDQLKKKNNNLVCLPHVGFKIMLFFIIISGKYISEEFAGFLLVLAIFEVSVPMTFQLKV